MRALAHLAEPMGAHARHARDGPARLPCMHGGNCARIMASA